MKDVKIYIKTFCPYSRKAMDLLQSKGIEFTIIDALENEQEFEHIKQQTGSKTVPQVFIDGQFVGGCDDIHALDVKNQLDEMLGL